MIILSMFLGGLARALVGSGHLSRWTVYPPVAAFAAYFSLTPPLELSVSGALYLWVVLIASLNLAMGRTDWEKGRYMALRFGLPSLLLVAPLIFLDSVQIEAVPLYVICSAGIGLIYPHREKLFGRLTFSIKSFQVDSARYMEFLVGAVILGGLSLF